MFYEGSPEYYKVDFNFDYSNDTYYNVAYLNNNNILSTTQVFIHSLYEEDPMPGYYSDRKPSRRLMAKLLLPETYYKSFIHKWFNKSSIRYVLHDEYIDIRFVKETDLEARISYLNILSKPNESLKPTIEKITYEFALKYPDIFLNKIQNYRGLIMSHPPSYQYKLNNTKNSDAVVTSY